LEKKFYAGIARRTSCIHIPNLIQTTFGITRNDVESGFLLEYLAKDIFMDNPFATTEKEGLGMLMKIAIKKD
jgi:pyruvate, orthophosphate dikinase